MNKRSVIKELESLVSEGETIVLPTKWRPQDVVGAGNYVKWELYAGWHTRCLTFLRSVFPEGNDFITRLEEIKDNRYAHAAAVVELLKGILDYLKKGIITIDDSARDTKKDLDQLFLRFNRVARQLRTRHDHRETIVINDEYDVQDLLHALLKLYFDDVRAEEWTPSYAGKSARMDFLLKKEKKVIEVKMTRETLTDKEIGDQLIVDAERYSSHPDCKKLICFVYDPDGYIRNPDGLKQDLTAKHSGFVDVRIEPHE